MKKIIITFFIFVIFPLKLLAVNEVNYDITKYNIEADIVDNGNVNVCEYIKMTGSFNGYVREVFYKAGDAYYTPTNLKNFVVYDLNVDTMTKGSLFEYVDFAYKGESLKYYTEERENGIKFTMFNANEKGDKGFVLCYTLEDAILVHNDVAELYYNFIPNGFEDLLQDVEVKVNLNGIDESLRVWAHGALYGNVSKENNGSNSYLLAKIKYVNPGEIVNVRMTFDKELVKNSTRFTNKNTLDEIISEETILADEANRERTLNRIILISCIGEFILFVGFLIYTIIYCYLRYDKEHKIEFNMEYYREFPNTYGPETLEYLIKHNNTSDAYSASILNMIYKKNIIIEEIEGKKDYILKKVERFNNPLTLNEGIILDFILNEIGNGLEVKLSEIKKYGKTESKARKFLKHFESWKNKVAKDAIQYNFFETKGVNNFFIATIIIFIFVTFFMGTASGLIVISFFSILLGVGTLIYLFSISKRTKEGMLEYKKWMAFKKFLQDFGRFDEKELPEILLWEKYLVYASIFGIADKLENTMKIKIEMLNSNSEFNDTVYMNYLIRNNMVRTVNSTISNCYSASRSTMSSSSNSSGSGSGGGFSGGGSFSGGGGGGGGHGF